MKLTAALLAGPLVAAAKDATFSQPVLWQDLPNLDIIRVGDKFYMTSSSRHYSPGGPILRSEDLVGWEYWSHAVTDLAFPPAAAYDLDGDANRYGAGIASSCLAYRESGKKFYWAGCVGNQTFVYTSPAADGTWKQESVVDTCYEGCGMRFSDGDDSLYVVHSHEGKVSLAELDPDDLKEVNKEDIWQATSDMKDLKSTRLYHKEDKWYVTFAEGEANQYVLRSDEPWGPYESHQLLSGGSNNTSPVKGASNPQQGGLVDTQNGDWYYMGLVTADPGGQLPVLAPVSWANGWPEVKLVGDSWATKYPLPLSTSSSVKPLTGKDEFSTLGPQYEWNHDTDESSWFIEYEGLQLRPVTVTDDFFRARNTLTHRILGPKSTMTVELNTTYMADGDRAGVALLRYQAGWVGVAKDDGKLKFIAVNNVKMEANDDGEGWHTVDKGTEVSGDDLSAGGVTVWLRVEVDISPEAETHEGVFSVSTDGSTFEKLGEAHSMDDDGDVESFPAYRYGMFSYSATKLGGRPTFASLDISQ